MVGRDRDRGRGSYDSRNRAPTAAEWRNERSRRGLPAGMRPPREPIPREPSQRPWRSERVATTATAPVARCPTASRQRSRANRANRSIEREEIQAAEATPEALDAGREILDELLKHMGLNVDGQRRDGRDVQARRPRQ